MRGHASGAPSRAGPAPGRVRSERRWARGRARRPGGGRRGGRARLRRRRGLARQGRHLHDPRRAGNEQLDAHGDACGGPRCRSSPSGRPGRSRRRERSGRSSPLASRRGRRPRARARRAAPRREKGTGGRRAAAAAGNAEGTGRTTVRGAGQAARARGEHRDRPGHGAGSFENPGTVQLRSSFRTASCVESRWSGVTATRPSSIAALQSEPGMFSFVGPPSPPIQ